MALLGWLFIGRMFRPFLLASQIDSYIAGLIVLAAAPCTAMVFVWRTIAGCIVTSDDDDQFRLHEGLVARRAVTPSRFFFRV